MLKLPAPQILHAAALLLTFLGALVPPAVLAQPSQEEIFELNIPAQPMADALNAFARATQRQVAASGSAIRDMQSRAVAGSFTAPAALERMLEGSGLIMSSINDVDFSVSPGAGVSKPDTVPERYKLAELTVYGERINRSLQDTQSSISLYTGEELDRDVGRDLFDLIDRTPGVTVTGTRLGFTIRGVSGRGIGGAGSGSTINIMVDGASLPPERSLLSGPISTWDLAQVEVFRGAQSTQTGQNALAGAIHIRSADPIFGQEFKLRVDQGTLDERRYAAAVNVPLGDRAAIRLSAESYETEGDIRNAFTGEEQGDRSLDTYRLKFRVQPTDQLDIIAAYVRADNSFPGFRVDEAPFPQERIASTGTLEGQGENEQYSLRARYEVNDRWNIDLEAAYVENDFFQLISPAPVDPLPLTGGLSFVADTTSFEAGASYGGERVRANVGVFYSKRTNDELFGASFPGFVFLPVPPGVTVTSNSTEDSEITNLAVFGEAEIDLNDRWMLTVGARFDREEQESLLDGTLTLDPPLFELPPLPAELLEADYDAFLPKVGILYRWHEDLSGSFTVQRGYRAGGAETLLTGGLNEFDPEFTTTYEFALRSQFLDRALTANANVYYTDWEDQQVVVPGPSGTFLDQLTDNAGSSKLYGVELETTYAPTANTEFYLTAAYAVTELSDFIAANQLTGEPENLRGNEFAQAPRWTGSVGVAHRFTNRFDLDLDGGFTDQSFLGIFNDPAQISDSFFIVNARIGYRMKHWSAHLYARNLFDRQYLTRRRLDDSNTAGDSRVVGVTLTADF
ncbi:MAG: TonB-dependent receptor [Pseudomonadota bacterium]